MSSPPPPTEPEAIPASLRAQLEDFRKHLWRRKILEAAVAGFIGLVASFLLVYGLDRLWPTPGVVRFAVLLAGVSLLAVFAPYWIHRWVWRHRRENQLARLISRRFPGLGDRLLGVIELQSQHEQASSLSPRLRAAAMETVAAEAGRRDLAEALPPGRHRKWSLAAFALLALAITLLVVTPRAGVNALKRWLLPFSDTPRYTFTHLDRPPEEQVVPFGESFPVTLPLTADSERRPASADGRYGLQPPVSTPLSGNAYTFTFPGQQEPGTITFRAGDATHRMRIRPVPRPAIESVAARIVPPAYLSIPERTVDLATGALSVVEGSRVEIQLQASRPLRSAAFGPTVSTNEAPGKPFVPASGELMMQGRYARSPMLEVDGHSFEIPFDWADGHGLRGSDFKLRIDAFKDATPTAYLPGAERQKAILPEETIDFEVLAEDDHGVKLAGLEWQGEFTRPTQGEPAHGEIKLEHGGPEMRRVNGPVAFSPGAFGIAPQQLTLRAWVEDYFPNRGRIYSEPVVLYVLTRDEHAQMLKSRFDRAIAELEDIARREQNQFEENQRIERLEGEELQNEESRNRLDIQQQAEAENTRRMDELTKRMEQLLKDSARNKDIEKETLRKMAEALKSMQELAQKDMPAVDGKLGDSQERTNTPDKTKRDVREAVENQQKVLEKMQQAIAKANESNQRMEASTFVNRLKKAAAEEEGIASILIHAAERLYGLPLPEVDPADRRVLSETTHQQAETASDIRWLQEDLGHYIARTENAAFKEILDEMRESKIDLGLEEIRNRLILNHSSSATGGLPHLTGAKEWAAKLAAWAKKLDGDKQGAGGGGGSGDSEDEDFEFMLRVMQMVQKEQDLRASTRALEQLRRSLETPSPLVP
jgi:hypothetical protein